MVTDGRRVFRTGDAGATPFADITGNLASLGPAVIFSIAIVPGSGVANHKNAIEGNAQRNMGQPNNSQTTPATQIGIDHASSCGR